MKISPANSVWLLFLICGVVVAAEERRKRQAAYGGNYNAAAAYRQPQQQQQQQYIPQQQVFPPPPQQYVQQQQQQQHYGAVQQRPASRPEPKLISRPHAAPGEEEKDEGPHPLQLLLEKSKFECGSKSDGYYADSGVGCQAFHYCVSGHKHSMMCPAGTVFHQVHLNCVPADQDICAKSDQFYFVNDYLNKPLEQRGPNNTVQYYQRYYPEGYVNGDPFIPPQDAHQPQVKQQQAAYQQTYQQPQPQAPFTPQQAGYGHAAQAPVPAKVAYQQVQQQPQTYQQPAQSRPLFYQQQQQQQQSGNYRPDYNEQQQALQAHRSAEAAVRAQHYQATRQQLAQQLTAGAPQNAYQQQAQQQPQYAYGAGSRQQLPNQY